MSNSITDYCDSCKVHAINSKVFFSHSFYLIFLVHLNILWQMKSLWPLFLENHYVKRCMKNPQSCGFTLIANCLQTVKLTAISSYKQHENIVQATKPVQCLSGLAADTSYVNAKATRQILRGALQTRPSCQLWTSEVSQIRCCNKLFLYFKGKGGHKTPSLKKMY